MGNRIDLPSLATLLPDSTSLLSTSEMTQNA